VLKRKSFASRRSFDSSGFRSGRQKGDDGRDLADGIPCEGERSEVCSRNASAALRVIGRLLAFDADALPAWGLLRCRKFSVRAASVITSTSMIHVLGAVRDARRRLQARRR
jgi:hypothetical protein